MDTNMKKSIDKLAGAHKPSWYLAFGALVGGAAAAILTMVIILISSMRAYDMHNELSQFEGTLVGVNTCVNSRTLKDRETYEITLDKAVLLKIEVPHEDSQYRSREVNYDLIQEGACGHYVVKSSPNGSRVSLFRANKLR